MSSVNMDNAKLSRNQIICACADACQALAMSTLVGFTSPALLQMENDPSLNLTEEQGSWIGAAVPGMALVGCLAGGHFMDVFGRRPLILSVGLPGFLAWCMVATASSPFQVITARLIGGLCLGIQQVTVGVYMSETVLPKFRPMLTLIPALTMMTGFLLMNLIGSMIGWREIAWIGAGSCLPLLIIFLFLPSTPYFLLKSGNTKEALECLKWLRSAEEEAVTEFKELQQNHLHSDTNQSVQFSELMKAPYRWPFCSAMLLHIIQQGVGISPISTFMGLILERSGSSVGVGTAGIVMAAINMLSVFIVGKLFSKYPTKVFLKSSSYLIVLSLVILSCYLGVKDGSGHFSHQTSESLSILPFLCLILFMTGFSFGWGPVPWMFLGTGLPLKIRGKVSGIATATNYGLNFIVTKTFSWLCLLLPSFGVFIIYACCTFFGQIIMSRYLPETFGMSDAQLDRYYGIGYDKKKKES